MIVWLCRTAMFKITLSQVLFSTWSGWSRQAQIYYKEQQ
jgi:hypothetical protein